jgi:small subunit ribosomal protein S1
MVVSRVKGGLTVDIGIKAFLPGSQIEVRPVRNLDGYIGTEIEVRVIKLNKKRGNVVISRKEILEEEQNAKKSVTLADPRRGQRPHRHGQEPHRLRRVSSTWAASTACCTSPT